MPLFDEITKKLLLESAICTLHMYDLDLKAIFTAYMAENYRKGEILLSWEELILNKKKLTTPSFIQFLKDAGIFPSIMSIETIEDIMLKIIPPV